MTIYLIKVPCLHIGYPSINRHKHGGLAQGYKSGQCGWWWHFKIQIMFPKAIDKSHSNLNQLQGMHCNWFNHTMAQTHIKNEGSQND